MLPILLTVGLVAAQESKGSDLKTIIKAYYESYKSRDNFERFLSFYDQDMVLEDMITGDRKVGKKAFAAFFDWNNPNFKLLEPTALVIENQVFDSNQVVTQGYFNSFKWGEHRFGPMFFTTILTFNEEGKIIKHVDWINYPNELLDYQKRKDSNNWISKNN